MEFDTRKLLKAKKLTKSANFCEKVTKSSEQYFWPELALLAAFWLFTNKPNLVKNMSPYYCPWQSVCFGLV